MVQESLRVSGMYCASRKQETALSLLAKACFFAYIRAPGGPGNIPCSMQKCYVLVCDYTGGTVSKSIKVGDILELVGAPRARGSAVFSHRIWCEKPLGGCVWVPASAVCGMRGSAIDRPTPPASECADRPSTDRPSRPCARLGSRLGKVRTPLADVHVTCVM